MFLRTVAHPSRSRLRYTTRYIRGYTAAVEKTSRSADICWWPCVMARTSASLSRKRPLPVQFLKASLKRSFRRSRFDVGSPQGKWIRGPLSSMFLHRVVEPRMSALSDRIGGRNWWNRIKKLSRAGEKKPHNKRRQINTRRG